MNERRSSAAIRRLFARAIGVSACVVALAATAALAAAADPAFDLAVEQTLEFAAGQALGSVALLADPSVFPRSVDPATGVWSTRTSSNWVSGFFPGMLWLLYRHTGDADLLDAARDWTAEVAGEATRTDTHDLGFMIGIPFGLGLELTGEPSYETTLLTGAASLSSRFDSDVGAIRSWDFGPWEFPVIIDNMMNLEFLFSTASLSSDPVASAAWVANATSHALVSGVEHQRPNGSTYHLVNFDQVTGAVLSKETYQGFSSTSTWSRGQGWGIYGFAVSYRETGDATHLATAMALADFYIDNVPSDWVPYWDFDAPNIPNEPRDSSAAAIAAGGMLHLSTLAGDPMDRAHYRTAAKSILESLMSPAYLSDGVASPALLLHGTSSYPHGNEVDFGLIWGDYYFVEALLLYQELEAQAIPTVSANWLAPIFWGGAAWVLSRRARRE